MKEKQLYIFVIAVVLAAGVTLTALLLLRSDGQETFIARDHLQADTVRTPQPQCDTISILIMGDIMQHITQLRSALRPGKDLDDPASYDYSSYFTQLKEYITRSDYSVANMEFTVGVKPYSGYPRFSAPESLAEEVAGAGIDLFLCANNHICDKGKEGIASTINLYHDMDISYTGIYRNEAEESEKNPLIAEINGIRVAFINFTYGTNGLPIPEPYIVNMMDSVHVKRVIMRAKEDSSDFIIVLPHWGEEYSLTPSGEQKRWREMLYREGIDIIIGSHPHVIQPLEIEKEKGLISRVTLFSTGNLISNMDRENTQLGIALELRLARNRESGEKQIISAEPIYTWSARRGEFNEKFTIIPVREFIGKRDLFLSGNGYDKMIETYNKLNQNNL